MPSKDPEYNRLKYQKYYAANKDLVLLKAANKYAKEKERIRARQKELREANKDRYRVLEKIRLERSKEHPDFTKRTRKYVIKYLYGITEDEYNRLLSEQQFCCKICGSDDPKGRGSFHIDHCHKTGRVRGLLCANCNSGLGHFKDNPEFLRSAANYVAT